MHVIHNVLPRARTSVSAMSVQQQPVLHQQSIKLLQQLFI
jgi:hypothetical protein